MRRKDKPHRTVTLRMTYEEHDRLATLADKKGVTMSGLIRELVAREARRRR